MKKLKLYDGRDLEGVWHVTYKADGVRMLRDDEGRPISRQGKPLHNLEGIPDDIVDAEIFRTDWATSVSLVRTQQGQPVLVDDVYALWPTPDPRLHMAYLGDPDKEVLGVLLQQAIKEGWEGLVIRQGDVAYKVKPIEDYDVKITGYVEGKGKHTGRLGLFTTDMGNVGGGFTDAEREEYWERRDEMVGTFIEVRCMGLTPAGKFRHPRFLRERWDK